MPNPWRQRALDFNKRRKQSDEQSSDLITLLNAMPKGAVKQLYKDDICAAILEKYGVTENAEG